jgi:hypothetical protein
LEDLVPAEIDLGALAYIVGAAVLRAGLWSLVLDQLVHLREHCIKRFQVPQHTDLDRVQIQVREIHIEAFQLQENSFQKRDIQIFIQQVDHFAGHVIFQQNILVLIINQEKVIPNRDKYLSLFFRIIFLIILPQKCLTVIILQIVCVRCIIIDLKYFFIVRQAKVSRYKFLFFIFETFVLGNLVYDFEQLKTFAFS